MCRRSCSENILKQWLKKTFKVLKKIFDEKFSYAEQFPGVKNVEKIRKEESIWLEKLLKKINEAPENQAAEMVQIYKYCCQNPLGVLHPTIGLNENSLSWYPVIKPVLDEMEQMNQFLFKERLTKNVLPEPSLVWEFTELFNVQDTKAVILGIATYTVPTAANGLAFSTKGSIDDAYSLRRIYDALEKDVDFQKPDHGDLTAWASSQHVLLMNINLSVLCNPCSSDPKSHSDDVLSEEGVTPSWGRLTGTILKYINENCKNVVFMLWGLEAENLASKNNVFTNLTREKLNNSSCINDQGNLVLISFHPAASRHNLPYHYTDIDSFLHCHHFSACNDYLTKHQKSPIDWQIPPKET